MKKGKIIKSLAGFYEVHTGDALYRCRARGIFRVLGQKPLVGDDVEIEVTDEDSDPKEGSVVRLLPRANRLVRPNVANVDQAVVFFAVVSPDPSPGMVDRFLLSVACKGLPAVLCFNKTDLAREEEIAHIKDIYKGCGCRLLFISTQNEESLQPLREVLEGRTSVLTGPSGVGKSTLINLLCPGALMQTGELSRKIRRGKNTTRHVELLPAGKSTWLVDTPGFTSLYLPDIEAQDLQWYYDEFEPLQGKCRFQPCMHMAEPACAVRTAAEEGLISSVRYENYRSMFEELKERGPVYKKREEKGSEDDKYS